MNNTTKAQYEFAKKMLKGKIDIEEVHLMTNIPIEELKKLADDVAPQIMDAKVMAGLDNHDFIIDNNEIDEDADANY